MVIEDDKFHFDTGVLTVLALIIREGITISELHDYHDVKMDEYVEKYGIHTYDALEELLQ